MPILSSSSFLSSDSTQPSQTPKPTRDNSNMHTPLPQASAWHKNTTKNIAAVFNIAIITLSLGFSALTLLTFWVRSFLVVGSVSCIVCRTLKGIAGLYSAGGRWHCPLPHPAVTMMNVSRQCQCLKSPGGTPALFRITA